MTQTNIDLINHLGFQMSLLKLATIPGPNGNTVSAAVQAEAQKIEALVERIAPGRS